LLVKASAGGFFNNYEPPRDLKLIVIFFVKALFSSAFADFAATFFIIVFFLTCFFALANTCTPYLIANLLN